MITIVQARTGSTRLPGKVLETIGDRTILDWVLHRLSLADNTGQIIIATTPRTRDNPIAAIADNHGLECHRSSEQDVLHRFYTAVETHDPLTTHIARITADCPLLCPRLLEEVIEAAEHFDCDYVAVDHCPAGLGQEVISRRALETSWQEAILDEDREHVITYIERNPDLFELAYIHADPYIRDRENFKYLTLDTPNDLMMMRAYYEWSDGEIFDMNAIQILEMLEAQAAKL